MVELTFIEPSGKRKTIAAAPGQSVMVAATAAGVAGIAAECGGSCVCATCHCRVVEHGDGLPAMEDAERDTLEFTADAMGETSRLTCQIEVTPALEGVVFEVVGH